MRRSLETLSDLDAAIAEVESRLVDEYGTERRAIVHRAVEEERHRFDRAAVHAFVPILVERSVREQLS
jgi:translation initiation factor 2 alpha subunit (eIF-2alpha)